MSNTPSGSFRIALAIILSIAGLAISAHLLQEHVKLETGQNVRMIGPECKSVGRISCDEVLKSDWGYFPFGKDRPGKRIPTAMLGFFFFAATSAWFLVVGRPSGTRATWHWFAVLLSLGGAAFAGYLDYVMWYKMPTSGAMSAFGGTQPGGAASSYAPICPYCLATHIIAGLLFIVTLFLWPRRRHATIVAEQVGEPTRGQIRLDVPTMNHPSARILLAFIVMTMAISASAQGWYKYALAHLQSESELADAKSRLKDYDDDYEAVYFNFAHEPALPMPIAGDDTIRGRADAPHTIVMFTDLQCEYCRHADEIVREKVNKYPDRLRLIVKHYPLNKTCNQYAQGNTHVAACAAAVTLEAVRAIGGDEAFWKMYDELFSHQAGFAKGATAFVKEAAARIGVDNDAIWKKINSRAIWGRVNAHVEQAHALGVESTPAVYFDGRKVAAWANGKFWDYLMFLDKQGKLPAFNVPTTQPSSQPASQGS